MQNKKLNNMPFTDRLDVVGLTVQKSELYIEDDTGIATIINHVRIKDGKIILGYKYGN